MSGWRNRRHARIFLLLLCSVGVVSAIVAFGSVRQAAAKPAVSEHAKASVTITLEGPNQWSTSGSSFGKPWEQEVARFEKANPGVKVNTVVLPLSSFFQTESTQLAAGTAPELVFNQASYKPYMLVPLDSYFSKPNPYAPGKSWFANFNPKYFGSAQANADGHYYWVPFNLVGVALYANLNAFAKAGVKVPIKTWQDLRQAASKLKKAGYTPLAMDNSAIGSNWTLGTILDMMLRKYYGQWNHFNVAGNPGVNATLTTKDQVWAIKTGKLTAQLPEIGEALQLDKELFTRDVTPNWSGITGLSGSVVGLADFMDKKAALAWGVDFGYNDVAKAPFKVGSIPFPTITKATTTLAAHNAPAEFGVGAGGSSYMIPSSTKGDKLKYAIRFLQFMSAPKTVWPWLQGTGGIPALLGLTPPPNSVGFLAGAWGKPMKVQGLNLTSIGASFGTTFQQIVEGYILGTTDLNGTLSALQSYWNDAAAYQIKQNNWGNESWAQ